MCSYPLILYRKFNCSCRPCSFNFNRRWFPACSIGFRSGLRAGQFKTLMLFCCKKFVVTLAVSWNVLFWRWAKCGITWGRRTRSMYRTTIISSWVKIVEDNRTKFHIETNTEHDAWTPKNHFQHAIFVVVFSSLPPHPRSPCWHVLTAFIGKDNIPPFSVTQNKYIATKSIEDVLNDVLVSWQVL